MKLERVHNCQIIQDQLGNNEKSGFYSMESVNEGSGEGAERIWRIRDSGRRAVREQLWKAS